MGAGYPFLPSLGALDQALREIDRAQSQPQPAAGTAEHGEPATHGGEPRATTSSK
jgi:hypothetical protein